MEGAERLSGENKVNDAQNIRDMDIADFAEEYLGCHLFWFQKQILREMDRCHRIDNHFLFSRAIPHSGFRYIIFLEDYLEKTRRNII
jgi:hypothetical protein